MKSKERLWMIGAGLAVGVICSRLVVLGNPANMGFCIACFLRDIAGGVGLHRAGVVQYIRPEIIGLVLGAMVMALAGREFQVRGADRPPVIRFVLGFCVMVGALMFLGCPAADGPASGRRRPERSGWSWSASPWASSRGTLFLKKGFSLQEVPASVQGGGLRHARYHRRPAGAGAGGPRLPLLFQ